MSQYVGSILEFHLEPDGRRAPWILCESDRIPGPGEYVLAHAPSDPDALLAEPVFLQQKGSEGFLAAPLQGALPQAWTLGAKLILRGPLGKGFNPPGTIRNLALIALGDTVARLLPLLSGASNAALFTDLPSRELPTHVEIQPLEALPEAFGWADFIAADIPLNALDRLPEMLTGRFLRGQVLVTTPMPCAGLGDCGVCAARIEKKYRLLCKDGPVLDLQLFADPLTR